MGHGAVCRGEDADLVIIVVRKVVDVPLDLAQKNGITCSWRVNPISSQRGVSAKIRVNRVGARMTRKHLIGREISDTASFRDCQRDTFNGKLFITIDKPSEMILSRLLVIGFKVTLSTNTVVVIVVLGVNTAGGHIRKMVCCVFLDLQVLEGIDTITPEYD